MKISVRWSFLAAALVLVPASRAHAVDSDPRALAAIQQAVESEIYYASHDETNWWYRDADRTDTKNDVYEVVQTPKGSLRRIIIQNGEPAGESLRESETQRIAQYVGSPSAQAKRRKDNKHDDDQAAELLRMLPKAYLWSVAGESPETITLNYKPDPAFSPPTMESRVMGAMAGEVVINKAGHHIQSLRGKMQYEVKIGFGLLGKINRGGTFDVERRPVDGQTWEITAQHVHIGGHALLFKTIGQQEDEEMTDFRPSPAKTLQQAEQLLSR